MSDEDNWKHKTAGTRCEVCMWFVYKQGKEEPLQVGRCRRHAPTINGFPAVFGADWCGDHRLDENKI